ncbi:hypothetical protein C8Q79DRAFT_539074 [Trametes meyenii]|nr:hypothetical protein C8Q79DRAFT_539074 [Trametes meyenii]
MLQGIQCTDVRVGVSAASMSYQTMSSSVPIISRPHSIPPRGRLHFHDHVPEIAERHKFPLSRPFSASLHHDSTKAARLTPHRTPRLLTQARASVPVSGPRSEHSSPSRSTLAGSGLNRLSVAPEIQSVPRIVGRGDAVSRLPLWGPGEALRRGGAGGGLWDTAQGSGARPRPRRSATRSSAKRVCAGATSFSALRGSQLRGLAPLRNSIQTTLVLSCPLAIFSLLLCSSRAIDRVVSDLGHIVVG